MVKTIFALAFIVIGITHFLKPKRFEKIMPPWIPYHRFMVLASGFFEVLFGTLLLVPSTSHHAAWGLILLLTAVFPANVYMAKNARKFPGIPKWLLWIRLPLQFVLIGWAWLYT